MSDVPTVLTEHWSRLVPDAPALGSRLVRAYAEEARRYHNLDHLANVLAAIDQLADEADDVVTVRLAAWFHDAVYDVRAHDNEEQSARLAEQALSETSQAARGEEVGRLVRLTTRHDPQPSDANGVVLCDADLVVLASPPDAYAAYARAIREEYAHVPDDTFRAGRKAVLEDLLALPRLYGTGLGHSTWEPLARRNLTTEMEALRTPDQ